MKSPLSRQFSHRLDFRNPESILGPNIGQKKEEKLLHKFVYSSATSSYKHMYVLRQIQFRMTDIFNFKETVY